MEVNMSTTDIASATHAVGPATVDMKLEVVTLPVSDADRESGIEPGPDPDRRSYNSFATFNDPDGNEFLLHEVTTRLPGRLWED
jgi:hypothetical protein